MIDSINNVLNNAYKEQLDSIANHIYQISQNTDTWYNWLSSTISIASFVASVATIGGVLAIWWNWDKLMMTKNCQRAIILDLIRHMFINNAILEVVRCACEFHDYKCRPIEGVFARFATLESDTDLGRLSTNSKHYTQIHSVNSILRNYNIAVNIAEKHFADPNCPKEQKKDDIREIIFRSRRICQELITLGNDLGLKDSQALAIKHIRDYYSKKKTTPLSTNEKECILKRNSYQDHEYFDKDLGLTDVFDLIIKKRFDDTFFIFNDSPKPKLIQLGSLKKRKK